MLSASVITVFIGVKIGEKSVGSERISHGSIFWMLIGFVSFHCVVEVALTAHKMAADIAAKSKSVLFIYLHPAPYVYD